MRCVSINGFGFGDSDVYSFTDRDELADHRVTRQRCQRYGFVLGGGNTLRFSDTGKVFEVDVVGYNYGMSGFSNGTAILFAGGFQGSEGPVTINFAQAVGDISFNAEDFNSGPELFSFTAYNGAASLGTFTAAGNDPSLLAFVGVQATGTSLITSLTISDLSGNNIGLGNIKFDTGAVPVVAATPEPGSLALLGTGLSAVFAVRRRTKR